MWRPEYTTCQRWAEHAKAEWHLSECFAHQATQAPKIRCKDGGFVEPLTAQQALRQQLSEKLNGLIRKSLNFPDDMLGLC